MSRHTVGAGVYGVENGVRGAWTRGESPQELVLSDGRRLRLEPDGDGRPEWRLEDHSNGDSRHLTAAEAAHLAGDAFADYVGVRTRSEAEWLRAVADWCNGEAGRLERELAGEPA